VSNKQNARICLGFSDGCPCRRYPDRDRASRVTDQDIKRFGVPAEGSGQVAAPHQALCCNGAIPPLQCNRSVLFSRLILAERKRQGEPSDRPSNGSQTRGLD